MTEEQLRAIEARAEASTEGDLLWGMETFASREQALAKLSETLGRSESLEVHSVFRDDPDMSVFAAYTGNGPTSAANAQFFAGARRVVLELAAEVRRLQAERAELAKAEAAAAVMRDALVTITHHMQKNAAYRVLADAALAPDAGLAYSQRMAALEEVAESAQAWNLGTDGDNAVGDALARLDALPARTGR